MAESSRRYAKPTTLWLLSIASIVMTYVGSYIAFRVTDRLVFYRGELKFGRWETGEAFYKRGLDESKYRPRYFQVENESFTTFHLLAKIEALVFGQSDYNDTSGRTGIRGSLAGHRLSRNLREIPPDFRLLEAWYEDMEWSDKASSHLVFSYSTDFDERKLMNEIAEASMSETGVSAGKVLKWDVSAGTTKFSKGQIIYRGSGDGGQWCEFIIDRERRLFYMIDGVDD